MWDLVQPPPKKYSRSISGRLDALGYSGGGEYQAEYDYGETFAIINKDATLQVEPQKLESKINEGKSGGEPEIKAANIYELGKNEKFVSGLYVDSAAAKFSLLPFYDS